LESLATPGGICISGTVYDQVETKLALTYEDVGEQSVKNIAKPVRVYKVLLESDTVAGNTTVLRQAQHERTPTPVILSPLRHSSGQALAKGAQLKRRGGLVLVLVVGTLVTIHHFSLPLFTLHSPLSTEEAKPPPLPLPAKPSIVVLPFDNLSKDPAQDYFSNGITDVLTSDLSRISSLFVIARNTAFTYQGKPVNIQYVLEGSVQKAGEHIRIVTQLLDTTTGGHLWAQRYDRPLHDLFALQDEIVQKIVTTLKLQLTLEEQGYVVRKHTDDLEAYDAVLRGTEYYYRYTQEANTQARQLFENAIALDPQYAEAYAWLGLTSWAEWGFRWSTDPKTLEQALALAQKAAALDLSTWSPFGLEQCLYVGTAV
jgi:adenylate cyclase